MAIDPASPSRVGALPLAAPRTSSSTTTTTPGGFAETLGNLLSSVDSSTAGANSAVASMLEGTGDVHEAMIALQKAQMMLELTVQVRNKLVQAYQDVMRMPI